ncbi:class I SAM-dependent methyltransferase [Ramlibacter sp. PS4R-6]|uniref:class I SAM-dependent methyltransferase n=1 Tax=Ramlibacter sp. PS4R-6 TaxID=3133438 RepID=UPI0030AA321C
MTLRNDAAWGAVAAYYEERVREHGATPWGVDWTCEPTQQLRFVQLLKVVRARGAFSLNDLGCGYGALLPFVRSRLPGPVDYLGVDVSPRMIAAARQQDRHAAFHVSATLPRVADYSVASGVFNVQLGFSPRVWRGYVKDTLRELARASRRAFAVNFILPPRPGVEPLEGLYRTRPATWAAFCAGEFGAGVEVVQGYGLREFTLLVRLPSRAARRGASGRVPSSRTAP